jgi:hypothetical protein
MREEKPFAVAKPRTPKGEARAREKLVISKMRALLSESTEESFKEKLEIAFGIKPGTRQFNDALEAWRAASSSR